MNKDQLQQELLAKIKPGIKASDLKKLREKNSPTSQIPTPPPLPPWKPAKEDLVSPIVQKNEEPAELTSFYCPACRTTKREAPIHIKVAQNDLEYNLIKGQTYSFCSSCAPKIKEFNEYDLITPRLWEKYPFSSASEILEKEFGIKEVKK